MFLSSSSDTLIVGGRNMNTLTIELPKETLEKLSLLQQAHKKIQSRRFRAYRLDIRVMGYGRYESNRSREKSV